MTDAVLSLLNSKNLSFTVSGRDYLIKCLNPDHEDSNPSLRVDKVSGIAHCFACGWKRNLFKHYGIFTNNTSVKVAKLKEKLEELRSSMEGAEMPKGATPFNRVFRGISTNTFKRFEAFYTFEDAKLQDRIMFPIKDVSGKNIAYIGRHMLADGSPRYLIQPRHKQIPLYPSVLEDSYTSIILVEGIFDMLNVYDKGLKNVVCCFGTQTLKNNTHEKLLPFKVQGVTKIYIMFDGDKAGKEATEELKPLLEENGFTVEVITLQDDTDPGDLDVESVLSIKEYINER